MQWRQQMPHLLHRTATSSSSIVINTGNGLCSSQQKKKKVRTAVLAFGCLLLGYIIGCSSSFRNPYPVDMEAFQPPPEMFRHQPELLERSERKLQQQHVSSAAGQPTVLHLQTQPVSAAIAPAFGGIDEAAAAQGHATWEPSLDNFAEQFVRQSQLLQTRPPMVPGKSGNNFYTVVPHQVLSWYPRIVLFPRFLSNEQAEHIIQLAQPQLEPSLLGTGDKPAGGDGRSSVRTSSGVFLDRTEDPAGVLAAIEEKIAAVTFIPPSHGEDFNVLRYQAGQHYHSHMDTWSMHNSGQGILMGQRMATMVMYLNDVEAGGETVFKREGKFGAVYADKEDLEECQSKDYKYKPRKGDAILFFSLNPDLSINPRALHGACPVADGGEKWVVTKWLHDKALKEWDGEHHLVKSN